MTKTYSLNYGTALLAGFEYALENSPECFVMGQGLWSPWYVGNSMTDLEKKFGLERVIDTPVSESACTGAALGAALAGMRPIVVHPRMDFLLYAMDAIVNEAAKWRHMTGGETDVPLTIRAIINRGGQQGAQHSQALHAWFANIPGLRVVMPWSVADARDLLVSSIMCDDPVIFIDDRWLYEKQDDLPELAITPLEEIGPRIVRSGTDISLIGLGYTTELAMNAADLLSDSGFSAEVIDLRVLNPLNPALIIQSARKTGRLVVADHGWETCGYGAEVIAQVVTNVQPQILKASPKRISLPPAPAPCSGALESQYYFGPESIVDSALSILQD